MKKVAKSKKRKHVGPNHKVVSLYAEKSLHLKMKLRSASLGMALSKYLQYLATKDLKECGDFTVTPSDQS